MPLGVEPLKETQKQLLVLYNEEQKQGSGHCLLTNFILLFYIFQLKSRPQRKKADKEGKYQLTIFPKRADDLPAFQERFQEERTREGRRNLYVRAPVPRGFQEGMVSFSFVSKKK